MNILLKGIFYSILCLFATYSNSVIYLYADSKFNPNIREIQNYTGHLKCSNEFNNKYINSKTNSVNFEKFIYSDDNNDNVDNIDNIDNIEKVDKVNNIDNLENINLYRKEKLYLKLNRFGCALKEYENYLQKVEKKNHNIDKKLSEINIDINLLFLKYRAIISDLKIKKNANKYIEKNITICLLWFIFYGFCIICGIQKIFEFIFMPPSMTNN